MAVKLDPMTSHEQEPYSASPATFAKVRAALSAAGAMRVTAYADSALLFAGQVPEAATSDQCEVYWGSHGCHRGRGHEGFHECDCCECPDHIGNNGLHTDEDGDESLCVATWPYYGPDTQFWGADAPSPQLT